MLNKTTTGRERDRHFAAPRTGYLGIQAPLLKTRNPLPGPNQMCGLAVIHQSGMVPTDCHNAAMPKRPPDSNLRARRVAPSRGHFACTPEITPPVSDKIDKATWSSIVTRLAGPCRRSGKALLHEVCCYFWSTETVGYVLPWLSTMTNLVPEMITPTICEG